MKGCYVYFDDNETRDFLRVGLPMGRVNQALKRKAIKIFGYDFTSAPGKRKPITARKVSFARNSCAS